jgi:hypothetical protein
MKRVLLLMLLLVTVFQGFSQTVGISYQAVLTDSNPQELPGENAQDNPLVNSNVAIQFTVVNASGTEEYQEQHNTYTDRYGMINLLIGKGTQISSNSFTDILWDATTKTLKVEIDFTGGTNFDFLSEQNLTYIPQPATQETTLLITTNATGISDLESEQTIQNAAIALNSAKVSNIAHPLVEKAVPSDALFTDTVYDDTTIKGEVALNSAKVSNIAHPLVEKAVPSDALFTDTVYDDTTIKGEVAVKADLASPTFTGTPTLPTGTIAVTQTSSDSSTAIATTEFVTAAASSSNFVDLTTNQTVSGNKSFSSNIDVSGKIGIGTSTPNEKLHISSEDSDIDLTTYGSDVSSIHFEKAKGTSASPVVLSSFSRLGYIEFKAYDGSQFGESAAIYGYTDGTQGNGSTPGSLWFATTPSGSDSYVDRMEIDSYGDVTVFNDLYVEDDLKVTDYIKTGTDGTDGELRIYSEQGGTDYLYTIKPNTAAIQDVILTLPADDGEVNQVLQTNGSGILSWSTPTSAGLAEEDNANAIDLKANIESPIFTGNVGIGTGDSNLTANFEVAGTVKIVDGSEGINKILTSDANGLASWQAAAPAVREVADEFLLLLPDVDKTTFTLTQAPSINSKVKMYINGVRISNTAYSIDGTALTYDSEFNGDYTMLENDRIQFDYFY